MRIGVDASYLDAPFNGIGQVTIHLLRALQQACQPDSANEPPMVSEATRIRLREVVGDSCEFYLYLPHESTVECPVNFPRRVVPSQFPKRSLSKKWWEMWQLPRAVRADRCDALISLSQSAAVLPSAIPHLMVVHDIIHAVLPESIHLNPLPKRIAGYLTSRGIRRATHSLTVSHYTKNDMQRHLHLPDAFISVGHIAADPIYARNLSSDEVDAVLKRHGLARGYIYHGGGFTQRKNARGVLQAYALLLKDETLGDRVPPIAISGELIQGLRYIEELKALIQSLGIRDRVFLLGKVPQEDMPALYQAASVFIYPSFYEGFGLPVIEAMHQGTPVITANTSSLPEVGGDAAVYCDPGQPTEMAQALRMILTDNTVSVSLGQRGRQRALEFSWDRFFRSLLDAMAICLRNGKFYRAKAE